MSGNGARTGLGIVLTAVFVLAGCGSPSGTGASSSSSDASSSTAAAATATASDGTVFTGTYAHDYRDAYNNAKTELGKGILKDGKITDAEWQELKDAYSQCAAGIGITLKFANNVTSEHSADYGKVSDDAFKEKNQQLKQCQTDTDFYSISSIRDVEEQDAQAGGDYLEGLLACYKRHGLVDQGMSMEEYKQVMSDEGRSADTFGKYTDSSRSDYDAAGAKQLESCESDPNS